MAGGPELLVSVEEPVGVRHPEPPQTPQRAQPKPAEALASSLDELTERKEVRCVVLRGAGGEAFSAGMDLRASLPAALRRSRR